MKNSADADILCFVINLNNIMLRRPTPNMDSTGCAVTPCSAISQASCRSPDDRRGAALPLEDVGEHVGENHIQKVFRKGGNGNHSSPKPRGSGAPLLGF